MFAPDKIEEDEPSYKVLISALQSTCGELHCYGETYAVDFASSQKLIFLRNCVSACSEAPEEVVAFSNEANSELYADGVGLPGNCKSQAEISFQVLDSLLQDTHHYNAGGAHLAAAAKLFCTAATVPLYFRACCQDKTKTFLGVLVLYFVDDPPYQDTLKEYLGAVALSASVHYNLLCKSAQYYSTSQKRLDEMYQSSKKGSPKGTTYDSLEIQSTEPSDALEAAQPTLSGKFSPRSEKVQFGTQAWFSQYWRKWKGGATNFLAPLKNEYCVVAFLGCFTVFAVLQVVFDNINDHFVFRDKTNLFPLPPSFGALSTLVFALPAAPLGQPRIILQAHSLAITVCVILIQIFPQYHYVWLQKALAAAFTIAGMAKIGILHPPAGALCIALIQYYNTASYSEAGLLFTIVSVYVCCAVVIYVAMLLHNVLKDRTYPICW